MPLALEGSTGGGDSGGPIFVDFLDGNGPVVVGDLNGGFNPFGPLSEYGDVSIWARLANTPNALLLQRNGIAPAVIPEPSSFLFLGLLGICLGGVQYSRRKRLTASSVMK